MPLRWLEEDDTHPVRPDLPVFRHLTFTEVHSLELGVYLGLLVYFLLNLGGEGAVVTILVGIVHYIIGDGRAKAGATRVTHNLGFHDVRQEPPYFGAGAISGFVLIVAVNRVWSVLGLGPILP